MKNEEIKEILENISHANHFIELTEMHDKMPKGIKEDIEKKLSQETLDALEWARDFMRK